jgi:hypothetical protein
MLTLAALGAHGQSPALPQLDENEAVLMQAYLRANPLGDGLTVFPSGTSGWVPLGEICRLLLFPIDVDARSGRAQGYFIRPGRTFSLDLNTLTAMSEGRTLTFTPNQVRRHGQELYVEAGLVETWFPLKVRLEFRDSSLYLTPREPLPIEEAWSRDRTNARLLDQRSGKPDAKAPFLAYPYQAFSLPVVDLSLALRRASNGASSSPQASANLGGDLLWMSSQIYLTRDSQGSFQSSRATLYRDDPSAELLGPMHARHVSIGDLQHGAALGLAGALPQGRALYADNHPLEYRTSFATRVFQGPLPVGWSVELFQNGGLVAYQQARPDGTYELPPVNLTFGLNLIKLVFHGPHGERTEKNMRLDISQEQPEPGAFYYRLTALQPQLQVAGTGTVKQILARPVYLADAEVGLTSKLSAQAGMMQLQFSDGTRTYGVGGLRTVLPWASMDLLGAASRFVPTDAAGVAIGKAGQFTFRTGVGYSNLTAVHAEYRGGFLPVQDVLSGAQSPLRSDDSLSLSSASYLGKTPFNASYTLRRQGYLAGWRESQRLILGTSIGRVTFSQSLGYNTEAQAGQTTHFVDAQAVLSSFMGAYSIQGEVAGRRIQGAFRLESYNLNVVRMFNSGLSFQGSVRGSLPGGSGGPNLTASLLQQKGRLGWALDGSYSRSSGTSVGIRLQASFGRDPRSRTWFTDAQPLAGMGGVSARAFLDANGNGKLDPGERLLEGARFKVGDTSRQEIRADATTAVYTGIGASRKVPITLDTASLEDTSLQPLVPAYLILPRAGVVTPVDYPVIVLGEAMGTCRLRRGPRLEEMPGLLVELVDASGRVLLSQRSAFDGFYEFRDLPLGKYQIRIPPSEVARLKLKNPPSRSLELTLEKAYGEGLDLIVEYLQESPAPGQPEPTNPPRGQGPTVPARTNPMPNKPADGVIP